MINKCVVAFLKKLALSLIRIDKQINTYLKSTSTITQSFVGNMLGSGVRKANTFLKTKGLGGLDFAEVDSWSDNEKAAYMKATADMQYGDAGAGVKDVTPGMVKKGVKYSAKGDSRKKTWEGQTKTVGGVEVKQFQPSTPTPPSNNNSDGNSGPSHSEIIADARARSAAAAERLGTTVATGGSGRATGGLMKKRKKK